MGKCRPVPRSWHHFQNHEDAQRPKVSTREADSEGFSHLGRPTVVILKLLSHESPWPSSAHIEGHYLHYHHHYFFHPTTCPLSYFHHELGIHSYYYRERIEECSPGEVDIMRRPSRKRLERRGMYTCSREGQDTSQSSHSLPAPPNFFYYKIMPEELILVAKLCWGHAGMTTRWLKLHRMPSKASGLVSPDIRTCLRLRCVNRVSNTNHLQTFKEPSEGGPIKRSPIFCMTCQNSLWSFSHSGHRGFPETFRQVPPSLSLPSAHEWDRMGNFLRLTGMESKEQSEKPPLLYNLELDSPVRFLLDIPAGKWLR